MNSRFLYEINGTLWNLINLKRVIIKINTVWLYFPDEMIIVTCDDDLATPGYIIRVTFGVISKLMRAIESITIDV